jgi:hypothetical protein
MAFFGNADPFGSPYAGILGNPVYSQGILGGGTPTAAQPGFSPVPTPQQPQSNPFGGFLQGNSNTLMQLGSALLSQPNFGMALANFGQQAPQAIGSDRRRKALNNLLMSKSGKANLDPETVAYLNSDPELASKYIGQSLGLTGVGQYGMTPIWMRDPTSGKVTLGQMNSKGGVSPVDLGGMEPLDPLHFVDTGTGTAAVGSRTGTLSGITPKDVSGAAAAQAQGTTQGNVAGQLPQTLASGQRMLDEIDALLNDPGLSRITGPIGGMMPNISGDAIRAQSRLDQVLGGTFLQAYNDLRGAGQISNAEGQSAKEAYNRLTTQRMSDADYRQALIDFRQELIKLLNIAQLRAAGKLPPLSPETEAIAPSAFGQQPAPQPSNDAGWTDLGNGVRIRAVGQ